MRIRLFFVFLGFLSITRSLAQGVDCASAAPFCTGSPTTFPASTSTTAAVGPNYGCLGSEPNPAWYYLQVATSGPITINIGSSAGVDVDYICWGPFTSPAAGCASGLTGSAVDCSYSASATETCVIPSALAGEVYILLITNFSGMPTNITFVDSPGVGTGTTDCTILCSMTAITATPGPCNLAGSVFDVTGTITYSDPPTTGTLVVTNSCSGATQTFNPPFPATSETYTLTGLPANGGPCTITALFTADSACTHTQTFTAPPPCSITCAVTAITAIPTACDPLTNNYDLAGNVTFSNPPTTGTLTIINSCGGTPVVVNAPFTSPQAYSFPGLTSNGLGCTITASFSDTICTLSQNYTAPASCTTCPVTATNNGPLCGGQTLNLFATTVPGATYSWTGPAGFTSTLQNPVITPVTSGMGGNYTVTVNVVSPPCSSTSTTTFVLNPTPIPIVCSDQTVYSGTSALIYASGGTSYAWTPTTNLSCPTCDSTTASPPSTTSYCVVVSDLGCMDSACVKVNIAFPCPSNRNMTVPNAFSPNGDGVNDELCLEGWDDCITNFQIMIFDRWGEKVFESTKPNFCWNGVYKGVTLDPAVFVYFIKATYAIEGASPLDKKGSFDVNKKGNISIIK